jgi:hypothetical protein
MEKLKIIELRESLGAALAEWTLNASTEFIDAEKDNKELINIAKKRDIVVPSQDLAIFKTIYCEIGKKNGNGVVVTKEGAEEGLKSAIGQQININHTGYHNIVGWILDATIEGNFVIIYGALFKSAMREDFDTIKEMFADKELFVSFELHTMDIEGNFVAERRNDGLIYVTKMLVSGCGLLVKTTANGKAPAPACPKARVLDMVASKKIQDEVAALKASNTAEVKMAEDIIYAELFIDGQKCGQCGTCENKKKVRVKIKTIKSEYLECPYCEQEIEEKELYFDGAKYFHRPCQDKGEIILPSKNIDGKEKNIVDEIIDADYEGGEIEEAKKLTTDQRNALPDSDFALIQEKDGKKIRRFPINDEAHVRNALARLPQAKDITEEERKSTLAKILKKAKALNMTDIVEKHKAELEAEIVPIVEPIVPAVEPVAVVAQEVPVCPCVEEKPVKRVSVYTSYCIDTYDETTGSWKSKSSGSTKTTEIFKDGREVVTESANNSLYDSYVEKYTITKAELDEKVAAVKIEIEATIPVKVKEAVDVVIAERDAEIVATKTANDAAIKAKEDEIVALKAEKDGVIANKDVEIASLKVENSNFKAELESKKFTAEDIQKAKDDTTKIVARRILLADVNKEIPESELLDDKEFEIRKLRKENEELKASKETKPDFIVGKKNQENSNKIGGTLAGLVNGYCQGKSE